MRTDLLNSPSLQSKVLVGLVLVVTVLFGVVVWPLAGAVLWAVFIAIVFSSMQEYWVKVLRGRRGWAALCTLAVIVVSVLLPLALLATAVTQEASAFYQRLKSGDVQLAEQFLRMLGVLPDWARDWLSGIGIGDLAALQRKLAEALARSGNALTLQAFQIGQGTLEFVVDLFVMLYLVFFLLRDGPALAGRVARAVPLAPGYARRVMKVFATVVRATVKGNVFVAIVQGALGWLAFWYLGIGGALLWGAVMALLSLLPALGAAIVWVPVAIYLLTTDAFWSGIGLFAWGVLVIGLVDNVLRPILVGMETRMPDWLVLVATLGGLAVFGLNGFVVGPVIAATFIAVWQIFGDAKDA